MMVTYLHHQKQLRTVVLSHMEVKEQADALVPNGSACIRFFGLYADIKEGH